MGDRTATKPVVALVTDAIFPYHRGGKEMRYHELARRLARHADVHVYTMHWWDGPRVCREGPVTFHAICPRLPLYRGERRSIVQALMFALMCLRLLWRRFDVIDADHMPYIQLFPLWLVTRLRRKRLVVTWNECWGPEYWSSYLGRAGRIGWWFERASMHLPDHVIAVAPQTATRLRAYVGDRVPVSVAPNGVDLQRIRHAASSAPPCDAIVVGRLIAHKRIDMLLDAIALLRRADVSVRCRIIGNGPAEGALRAQATALGITDAVDFRHDVVDDDDLYSHLKSARSFVFPSEREGFGMAVLEALACGVTVITTSAPDNLARHLVARSTTGVVCEPEPAALADAMRGLLTLPGEGHAGSAAGNGGSESEPWLDHYDWNAITDGVAETLLA